MQIRPNVGFCNMNWEHFDDRAEVAGGFSLWSWVKIDKRQSVLYISMVPEGWAPEITSKFQKSKWTVHWDHPSICQKSLW